MTIAASSTVELDRKQRGAWYTPDELVQIVADGIADGFAASGHGPVRVIDPACGDGRLLTAVGDLLTGVRRPVELVGVDIDRNALDAIVDERIRPIHADALTYDWSGERFDLVVGNPPFLSQMSAATTRGGTSRHGGGPYADAAVEFLALAMGLAAPRGRVALVLPQSVLGARDAATVRAEVEQRADLTWSWWHADQDHFDASVNVCVLGFELAGGNRADRPTPRPWTTVVTDRLDLPPIDVGALRVDGCVRDRAALNANFRDEYYALVPAVSDTAPGPPLVTSGLIDPGSCHWGRRPVRFAKQRFDAPRVDLDKLTGRFRAWADRKLVPKVLVANQTRIIEAVADPTGEWLPGVPVTTATPSADTGVDEIAAVLTSPVASLAAWHHGAGTGLSTRAVRVGPVPLGAVPWPTGDLAPAAAAMAAGDLAGCATATCAAYGIGRADADRLVSWWTEQLPAGCA